MSKILINGKTVIGNLSSEVERALERRPVRVVRYLPLEHIVEQLAGLRQEWQWALEPGQTLEDVSAPVALLLRDVVELLGLQGDDKRRALGDELAAAGQ